MSVLFSSIICSLLFFPLFPGVWSNEMGRTVGWYDFLTRFMFSVLMAKFGPRLLEALVVMGVFMFAFSTSSRS